MRKRGCQPDRTGAADYARAVVEGKIPAGKLVRLACTRHLEDLKTGELRGLRFSEERALHVLEFFENFLKLPDGDAAGKPFVLQPWQIFVVASLFGWYLDEGVRRFRTAYVEIGKGNGKSPLAAGIGLYGLVEGERGAEVYSAAVTRDQAGIMFSDAKNMARSSPELGQILDVLTHNISCRSTGSYFRPVSSEARSLDGKRVHIGLVDEVHEHRTPEVIQKIRAGTKGRRNALILEITNSGFDRETICFKHHEYSRKVLEGEIQNDAWFAYVAHLDEGDDWKDESVWLKPNPNLGVSITRRYLREQVDEAIGMPSTQNMVKRLNFCIWTQSATRWLDMDTWEKCGAPFDERLLEGRPCIGGLDLSSTTDISGLVLAFDMPADEIWWLCRFWMPEERVNQGKDQDGVPYDYWVEAGYITATPGAVVDYGWIYHDILELSQRFKLERLNYDPWNASHLATDLEQAGLVMVQHRQGFASMSSPSKLLEALLAKGKLRHGGNPVLRWMAGNAVIQEDPAGNIKPAKDKSTGRIDGIVAGVMTLGHEKPEGPSVYEERGILTL